MNTQFLKSLVTMALWFNLYSSSFKISGCCHDELFEEIPNVVVAGGAQVAIPDAYQRMIRFHD
jgi:hypothetical protein